MSFRKYWKHNVLNEVLNTKAPQVKWNWNSGYQAWEATVQVEERSYGLMMSAFPWELGKWNIPEFNEKTWSQTRNNSWCFEFYEQREDGSQHHDVTGTSQQQAGRVLSIMGRAMIDLVKQKPSTFRNICFGGKEPSRLRLYARIAPRVAKELDKQLIQNDKKDHWFLLDKSIAVK